MTNLTIKTINIVLICIVIGFCAPCLKCKRATKMRRKELSNTTLNSTSKLQDNAFDALEVNISRPPSQATLLDKNTNTPNAPKRTRQSRKKRTKVTRNTTKPNETTGKLNKRKRVRKVVKSNKCETKTKQTTTFVQSVKNGAKISKRRTIGVRTRVTTKLTTTKAIKITQKPKKRSAKRKNTKKVIKNTKQTMITTSKMTITRSMLSTTLISQEVLSTTYVPVTRTTLEPPQEVLNTTYVPVTRTTLEPPQEVLSTTYVPVTRTKLEPPQEVLSTTYAPVTRTTLEPPQEVLSTTDIYVNKTTLEPDYLIIGAASFEDVFKNDSGTTESILNAARNKFAHLYKSDAIGKTSYGLRKITNTKTEKQYYTDFLPKVMIFETDRLFWPFIVETDIVPPFGMPRYQPTTKKRRTKTSSWSSIIPNEGIELYDRNGTELRLFPDTSESLFKLYKKGIKMAVAMTTTEIATVRHLLHLFDLDHLFSHMEIDVEPVLNHITGIKEELNVNYTDIVYLGTNYTVLEEIERNSMVLTVYVNPDQGLNIMHIYRAIYIYNLRPLLSVQNGKISLKGELVSDEVQEEGTLSETTFKPTPQKKPISSSKVQKNTYVKSTTETALQTTIKKE